MRKTREEYNKTYYNKHYEQIKERLIQKVECPVCKCHMYLGNLSTHKKTKKHLAHLLEQHLGEQVTEKIPSSPL